MQTTCQTTLNMTEALAKFERYLKSGIDGFRQQGVARYLEYARLANVNTSGVDLESRDGIEFVVSTLKSRMMWIVSI